MPERGESTSNSSSLGSSMSEAMLGEPIPLLNVAAEYASENGDRARESG